MLKKDFSKKNLLTMAREISSYNGKFEEIGNAYNDLDEFLELFSEKTKIVRAWSYGNANYNDEYFRINIYGNIESLSENELLEECEENRNEIIEEYVRLVQENNINDYKNFVTDELLKEINLFN